MKKNWKSKNNGSLRSIRKTNTKGKCKRKDRKVEIKINIREQWRREDGKINENLEVCIKEINTK